MTDDLWMTDRRLTDRWKHTLGVWFLLLRRFHLLIGAIPT